MGNPKKQRKRYSTPNHPWKKERIDSEKRLIKSYGLKNMKEVWKMKSFARDLASKAKEINAEEGETAEIEKENLLNKCIKLGLLPKDSSLDDVLGLNARDVLERRLQTVLVKKSLARTYSQSRQMITHRHVLVDGKVISSPSYLVPKSKEKSITFVETSPYSDEEHPERELVRKEIKEEMEGKKDKEDTPKKESKKGSKKKSKKKKVKKDE